MAGTTPSLPAEVLPMLARIGQPFDSDAHLFEVKWDGIRAVAYVEPDGLRLHSRHRRDLAGRYPELTCLRELPPGTILDGEIVVLGADGRPDFRAALSREQARGAKAAASNGPPVTFVAFDLLYLDYAPLLERPLAERKQRLQELLAGRAGPALSCSEGVVGRGRAFFAAIEAQGIEGMMSKRLDSRYRPGERTDAWLKIKRSQRLHCLILGYEPDGERDFRSLIVASDAPDGRLRCVGKVGTGFDAATRRRLFELLRERPRLSPLVDAGMPGRWVEPGLYCAVSFLEWTANGNLRGPVFLELVEEPGPA